MLTEQLAALDSDQQQRLRAYIDWYADSWLNTAPNDQESVAEVIGRVYRRLGRRAPCVIWCDSLWQLAVTPFLLKLVCFEPRDAHRRLLRRHYDSHNIQQTIRMKLARNLHDELWNRALSNLLSQLDPEVELAFHEAERECANTIIGIERAIGLHIEQVVHQAHGDLRQSVALNIIEQVMRDLAQASQSVMRAKVAMNMHLGNQLGRRFSDFNGSIRAGSVRFEAGVNTLVDQFIAQTGREFSTHLARLVTEDYSVERHDEPQNVRNPVLPSVERRAAIRWQEAKPEARLACVLMDYSLTWGSWSQDFFRLYMFPSYVLKDSPYSNDTRQQLDDLITLRQGAFMYVFSERVVFACKNPLALRTDERKRLHSYSLPAMEFLDGFAVFAWDGVIVPQRLVDCPELLTVNAIEAERNAELRRVMIDRYGTVQFLLDSGATILAQDEYGCLYHKHLPGDEPLVMVKVRNSTPEPDGTYKDYFLRVPGTM